VVISIARFVLIFTVGKYSRSDEKEKHD